MALKGSLFCLWFVIIPSQIHFVSFGLDPDMSKGELARLLTLKKKQTTNLTQQNIYVVIEIVQIT